MIRKYPVILWAGFIPGMLQAGEITGAKAPAALALPEKVERGHFRISAGAGFRSIGEVRFTSGSRSGLTRLPFLAAAAGKGSPDTGGADTYADRAYLDGFVRQDAGTAEDGSTWNWSYQDAAQISENSDGSRALTFHGEAPSRNYNTQSRSDRDPGSWDMEGDGAVPVVQLEWTYDLNPELAAGISMQYSFLGFDGRQDLNSFNAVQTQTSREIHVTDTYDAGDIVLPQAPYEGSFDGPGPLLGNRPSNRHFSRGQPIDRSTVHFFNRIEESLEVRLHQFTFGPTLATRLGPVQLALGAGLSLNVADWEAVHTETLFVRKGRQAARVFKQWSDASGGTDVLPGFYVQAAATIPLTPRLSLTAYGNHDWSKTLSGEAGPSHFSINPTGWTLGGMIGYSF